MPELFGTDQFILSIRRMVEDDVLKNESFDRLY